MGIFAIITVLLVGTVNTFINALSGEGPLCLSCDHLNLTGAEGLFNCTNIVQCPENQTCYVESFLNDELRLAYRAGCRSLGECSRISCAKKLDDGSRTKMQCPYSGEISICSQCCYKDMCNTKGCGSSYREGYPSPAPAPICFHCGWSKFYEGQTCTATRVCQPTEVCHIQLNNFAQPFNRYLCMSKKTCDILTSGSLSGSICCNTDFCNTIPRSSLSVSNLTCPTGLNTTTTTVPTTVQTTTTRTVSTTRSTSHCHDNPSCEALKAVLQNPCTDKKLAETVCPSTCGLCDKNLTSCIDTFSQCAAILKENASVCQDKTAIFNIGCLRSCKLCQGPMCYNCPQTHSVTSCQQVKQCSSIELCSITRVVEGPNAVFKLGCSEKQNCSTIRYERFLAFPDSGQKQNATNCSGCCDQDYCNNRCVSHR